jgi:Fic family protein
VRLWQAQRALPRETPLGPAELLLLHEAVVGDAVGFRTREAAREPGPPPAPPAFIESRLRQLAEWLDGASGRELRPAQAGALALARIQEILPFDEGNGRVSRLAASHVMVRAGARPPVLVGGDLPRLEAALQAAFRLETEPLASLLEEASERALDVMIQTLEGRA